MGIFFTNDRHNVRFVVDDAHDHVIKANKWRAHSAKGKTYIYSMGKTGKTWGEALHRIILNVPKGLEVDHIDGDPTNNRTCNLRICNHSCNVKNRKKNRKNQFKGLRYDHGKWNVILCVGRFRLYLGRYSDPVKAAKVWDCAARLYFPGQDKWFNFPDS